MDVKQFTGFEEETLDYVWEKYSIIPGCPLERKSDFITMLGYLHLYPTIHQAPIVLDCSKYFLENPVKLAIEWFATNLDEIHWSHCRKL
jgi:hypothetical protein